MVRKSTADKVMNRIIDCIITISFVINSTKSIVLEFTVARSSKAFKYVAYNFIKP